MLERLSAGAIAVTVAVGLTLHTHVTIGGSASHFHTVGGRIVTEFCLFTVDSNLIVGVVSAMVALRPGRTVPSTLRLVGVTGIITTGVVYHLMLAALSHPVGEAAVANTIEHTVVPIAFPLTWLLVGPPLQSAMSDVGWSLLPPLVWLLFTGVRGAIIDWYPYPFLDVRTLGYAAVLGHCIVVAVFFAGSAVVAVGMDRLCPIVGRQYRLT